MTSNSIKTIRCGKGHEHLTVESVRQCYGFGTLAPAPTGVVPGGKVYPAGNGAVLVPDDVAMAQMEAAGDVAEAQKVAAAKYGGEIPAGHYVATVDGVDRFFKIGYGKKGGKWEGFCFIDAQASDDYYPVKNKAHKAQILDAIRTQGPEQCMARYGHAIGRCGMCSKTLTDPESISKGIGPVCAAKVGW
jgi:hypothetical protein